MTASTKATPNGRLSWGCPGSGAWAWGTCVWALGGGAIAAGDVVGSRAGVLRDHCGRGRWRGGGSHFWFRWFYRQGGRRFLGVLPLPRLPFAELFYSQRERPQHGGDDHDGEKHPFKKESRKTFSF